MAYAITTADVQAELPTLRLSDSTSPNLAQVDQYIADTEAEIQAYWEGCPAPWPPDPSSAAWLFIRRTELEGVRWLVLRAKYAMTSGPSESADIARADVAYMARVNRLCQVARAGVGQTGGAEALTPGGPPFAGPLAQVPQGAPALWSSFGEWSEVREAVSAGRSGGRVWPYMPLAGR